jgi:hypothetical protein
LEWVAGNFLEGRYKRSATARWKMEAFMMTVPGPTLWARLPTGGWQVGFWVDVDGRTLVDVADPWGTLAYRVAGARRAAPSIDAGWAGCVVGPDGGSQCWALAIGHAPPGLRHAASFVNPAWEGSRSQEEQPGEALSGLRVADDGLWVAAAVGNYSHVRMIARSVTLLHPLQLVTD